jgi:surface antigen
MSVMDGRITVAPLILCLLFPILSSAQNLGFLKDSAVRHFDDQDVAMMMQNVDDALNDAITPTKREWKNAASGNSGRVEVLSAFKNSDSVVCKRARLSNVARNGITGSSAYTFCKHAQKWMIVENAK